MKEFIKGTDIYGDDSWVIVCHLEDGSKSTRVVDYDVWIEEQKEYISEREMVFTCTLCGEEHDDADAHLHASGVTVCQECVNVNLYDLRADIAGTLRDELAALLETFHDRLSEKYPYALRRSISEKLAKNRPSDMEDPLSRITDGSYTEDNIVG